MSQELNKQNFFNGLSGKKKTFFLNILSLLLFLSSIVHILSISFSLSLFHALQLLNLILPEKYKCAGTVVFSKRVEFIYNSKSEQFYIVFKTRLRLF